MSNYRNIDSADVSTSLVTKKLTTTQEKEVGELQEIAFCDTVSDESKTDFYSSRDACVITHKDADMVGYAGIHHANIQFENRNIQLGVLRGVCTKKEMRGTGIGTKINTKALKYLKERGDDVAFISADPETAKFYEKVGFVIFPRKHIWTNSKGVHKEDFGSMIAPVCSQELFEYILNGSDLLDVGDNEG